MQLREGFNMFKNAALAAAAATAFIAVPASAAQVVYTSGQNVGLLEVDGIYSGAFEANVMTSDPIDPAFVAEFFFSVPESGSAVGSAITIALSDESNIDFSTITLNGFTGTVVNTGPVSTAIRFGVPITANAVNTLRFTGLLNPTPDPLLNPNGIPGVGNGAFGGNVTVAAVPEPATWALFILGFGALGFAMRRRNAKVTVAKASLNFA